MPVVRERRPRVAGLLRPVLAFLLAGFVAAAVPAAAGGPAVRYEAAGDGTATLTVRSPGPAWVTNDAGEVFPEIEGFGRLEQPAAVDLPARVERVALDPGAELTVLSVDVEWAEGLVPGTLAAFPARDPRRPAADLAAIEGFWPAEVVRVVRTDGAFRTLRFAELLVVPLQVDPAAGRFRTARTITVRLAQTGGFAVAAPASSATGDAGDPLVRALGSTVALGAARVAGSTRPVPDIATLERGGPAPVAPSSGASTAAAPTFPAWQIEVDREAIYRLDFAWVSANLPGLAAQDPRRFRMTMQGIEVPIEIEGDGDGVFETGEAIVFYGQPDTRTDGLAAPTWQGGDVTDTSVYRIDLATAPLRVGPAPGTQAPPPTPRFPVPASFRATARGERDELFQGFIPQDGVDHWYARPFLTAFCVDNSTNSCTDILPAGRCRASCTSPSVCCGSSNEITVDTPGFAGGTSTVRARLLGFDTATDLHRTELYVNGALRDTQDWNGTVEFTHAPSVTDVLAATTAVKIRAPLGRTSAGNPVDEDFSGYNWAEIDYDRTYAGVGDRLAFTVDNADREVQLTGLAATARVWDLSDTVTAPSGMAIVRPRRAQGVTVNGATLRFESLTQAGGPAKRRFFAAGPAGVLAAAKAGRQDLAPNSLDAGLGSSLKDTLNGADWIVVGERSLLTGPQLQSLVTRRRSAAGGGLRTAIVDVRDVYDEFSDGVELPRAIRDFVDFALSNWTPPAPRYLLVVGDATRDFKNVYGYASRRQFVPTQMIDLSVNSQFGYYLSDTWFGAVRGGDAIPDILVGRIPAHSLTEAENVFRKIVQYESGQPAAASWAGKTMLVSENDGPEFINVHNGIYDRYFTSGPQVADKVYEDPGGTQAAADAQRTRVKNGVNAGAALLSFAGHGGYQAWARGFSFFESKNPGADDIDSLTNSTKLQFQVHANCITGHFANDSAPGGVDQQYVFLEDWLTTADKGIVAGVAPSHLAYNFLIDPVLDPFYRGIFKKTKERIAGALDQRMRLNLASLNDTVGVRSYVFVGDPATKLAIPAPPKPAPPTVEQAGSRALKITWPAVPGVAKYRVYRATSAVDDLYTALPDTTVTTLTDTGLENCREHFYYVVSVDASGFESAWSNFNDTCYGDRSDCRFGTPQNPAPPSQVQGVAVTDTQEGGRLRVTWTANPASEDVVDYVISYSPTPNDPNPQQVKSAGPVTSHVLGGLADRTRYYVRVRAEHCSLQGANSAETSGVPHLVRGINPPNAITDLKLKKIGANIELRWTAPAESVWGTSPVSITRYEIYRDTASPRFPLDAGRLLATVNAPTTVYTHTGAASGTGKLYYTVVAVDAAGLKSSGGDEYPDAVADLRVRKQGTTQVRFDWSRLRFDLDGRPLVLNGYNLYGRNSVLPRSQCGTANRLLSSATLGPAAVTTTLTMPAGGFFTWQLLGEDTHGGESVW